jgi:hypothetical protein
MIKKITVISKAKKVAASSDGSAARRPIDRDSLIGAVETERQRIFRARAITQTAAKLLHELYIPEKNEPDIRFRSRHGVRFSGGVARWAGSRDAR